MFQGGARDYSSIQGHIVLIELVKGIQIQRRKVPLQWKYSVKDKERSAYIWRVLCMEPAGLEAALGTGVHNVHICEWVTDYSKAAEGGPPAHHSLVWW